MKNYSKKEFKVLEQFEPTEGKCQKWSRVSIWKRGIASSFFQEIQWLANGWIIGQCCFHHLPLKEWTTYYQFRREKRVWRPSLWLPVLRLSSFIIVAWVELILWTRRTAAYRLDRKSSVRFYLRILFELMDISHLSIATSFITWSILTNCLSVITKLLSQKT